MGELASLITAITGLLAGLVAAAGFVRTWARTSRRERRLAADSGAEELAAVLAAAAEDGQITPEELAEIARRLRREGGAAS